MENTGNSGFLNTRVSSESALGLRERYLLEKQQIQNEIGDLKQILETLGLSQRRACQLLLVDPSAWTRWNKTDAPPHIYQALRWLIQLKKTNPDIVGPTDISSRLDYIQSTTQTKIKELERNLILMERALSMREQPPAYDDSSKLIFMEREHKLQDQIRQLEEKLRLLLSRKVKIKPKRKAHFKSPKAKVKKKKINKKLIRQTLKKIKKRKSLGKKRRKTIKRSKRR